MIPLWRTPEVAHHIRPSQTQASAVTHHPLLQKTHARPVEVALTASPGR